MQPERDYEWRYTYGHTGSVAAVMAGDVDAAPIASDVLARMVAKDEVKEDDLRSHLRHPSNSLPRRLGMSTI